MIKKRPKWPKMTPPRKNDPFFIKDPEVFEFSPFKFGCKIRVFSFSRAPPRLKIEKVPFDPLKRGKFRKIPLPPGQNDQIRAFLALFWPKMGYKGP